MSGEQAAASRLRALRGRLPRPSGATWQGRGSRARRVLSWVTPLGWGVLGLGLLAWVVGARWGWVELTMLAAAALVTFLACCLLAVGGTQVAVTADLDPTRVVVGDPATGRVSVTNTGRVPLLPLLIELPVGVGAARFVLPPLPTGRTHDELYVVPTHRRGVIPVGPARTVQGDPLGLVRRVVERTEVAELFVHPRTSALESLGAGLLRDLEGAATEDQSMSDLAFHALREYQPGDDRRHIHWRSSAKAGRLLVRQFLDTRRSHATIVVDVDAAAYRMALEPEAPGDTAARLVRGDIPPIPDLETAISIAGSIALRCQRDDTDATVVAGRHTAAKAGPQRTLDTLARVEPVDTGSTLRAAAVTAAALAPDTSVLFLITGPQQPFVELQRAANQVGPEVTTVVVVVDHTAEPAIRHTHGLVVLTVAELAQARTVLAAGVAG